MKRFFTIALLPLLVACAKEMSPTSPANYREKSDMEAAGGAGDYSKKSEPGEENNNSNNPTTAAPASKERLVIYNANMGIAVKDVQGTVTQIEGITEKYKGFVVS